MSESLFIVGPGRMGLALGYALWQTDTVHSLIYCGRRPEPPSHPLFIQGHARYVFGLERPPEDVTSVILAVPDDSLTEIAMAVAGHGQAPQGASAFHLSGALGTDPLAPLHARGYSVGTLHPFQTAAHAITGADLLPGSYFAVSGQPRALAAARRILNALGSPWVTIPVSQRPLYHVAGVFASNYLLALLSIASRYLTRAGVSESEAVEMLLPLARGTLRNLEELGAGASVTGPVVRGDEETIHLHLRMLEGRDREIYGDLGQELLESLRPADMDEDFVVELADLLGHWDGPDRRGRGRSRKEVDLERNEQSEGEGGDGDGPGRDDGGRAEASEADGDGEGRGAAS